MKRWTLFSAAAAALAKIGGDQLEDQARRRGADVGQLQRLLAPNL